MRSVKRILALAGRNVKEILRDPLSIIFMFALPVAMELMFYALFSSAAAQFAISLLAPGMAVFGQAFITLFIGILIATDRTSSFMIRLYTTELKSYEIILSYALAAIPAALIQGVAVYAAAAVLDISAITWHVIPALFAGIIPTVMFLSFGILFGSVCGEKSVGGVSSIIVTAQSMLSGMWFPPEGLSSGFLKVMDILPFKNASLVITSVFNGETSAESTLIPCLIVLGYSAVVFIISVFVYRRKMVQ